MSLIFVDCEAFGPCPAMGRLTEFGAVDFKTRATFHGVLIESQPSKENPAIPEPTEIVEAGEYLSRLHSVFTAFENWMNSVSKPRFIFVSDNPAYDFQWINYGFHAGIGRNPFGHSGRRIHDFYAGLKKDFYVRQKWKDYRQTPHDHNPVNDAMGNVEAFQTLIDMIKRGEFE